MRGYLARIPLFRYLPVAVLQQVGEVSDVRRFPKEGVLFEEGQPARTVWLIQRGWVHLVKRTPQGTPATLFTVTPEEVLCGFSAVVGRAAYDASAIAATETTAVSIPQEAFAQLVKRQPGFAQDVLALYHTRMHHLAQAVSLAQAPVEQRVAFVLLRLRSAFGNTLPITHHELARMAGTRWETSIRTLSSLKRRGIVASSRGRVTILAPRTLRDVVEGLRRHMDEEEQELFPLIEQHLAARETQMPAAREPLASPIDEVMTVNRLIQLHPGTKRVFEQLFVNIPYEGCDCLDEVAWRHGLEARELVSRLEVVIGHGACAPERQAKEMPCACS